MARRALLLANDNFADPSIPPLASPSQDGARLRDLLERADVGGYDVTYCENPNSVEARIAVQSFFRQASAGDFNLILISGHGIRDSQGHLHFATADTRSDVLAATSLDAAFVIKQMDLSPASKQLAIIDTCYSGAFVHGMVAKAATQKISRTDFDNGEIDNIRGRAVITASTHIQTANENEVNGTTQSIFTRHLIEGIESGAADSDKDGEIALPELFDYISAKLRAEGSVQTPRSYDYGLGGRVIVALNPAYSPAALPAALIKKLASKSKAQKLMAVEQLQDIAASAAPEAGLAVEALQKMLRDDFVIVRDFARDALDAIGAYSTPEADAEPLVGEPEPEAAEQPVEQAPPPPPPPPTPTPPIAKIETDPIDASARQPLPLVTPPQADEGAESDAEEHKKSAALVVGIVVAMLLALALFAYFLSPDKGEDAVAPDISVTTPETSGDETIKTTEPDINAETMHMGGNWSLSDTSGCASPALAITVFGPEIKINGESYNRDITSFHGAGWMKIGNGFYKQADTQTLLVVDDLSRVNEASRFVRCP